MLLYLKSVDTILLLWLVNKQHTLLAADTPVHPLLKATLTGFRKTYLRFLVFRPKLAETKRFPPILVHMNGKIFPGGSRFPSAKIDLKLAVGGSRSHNNGQEQYWKLITLAQRDDTFRHQWTKNYVSGQVQVPNV